MRLPRPTTGGFLLLAVLLLPATSLLVVAERQDAPVTFTRIDIGAPTRDRASTGGVSWIDVDGDGDLDLFVSNGYDVSAAPPDPGQADRLYLNEGGRFEPVEGSVLLQDGGRGSGHSWGDYDDDGDPDLFVPQQSEQTNLLYRNEGGARFVRVTDGPIASDSGVSFASSWADVDSDGRLDLLVLNGGLSARATNFLYRNLGGGEFERVTEGPLVTDSAAWGGAAWGDYDDDGDPDLFAGRNWAPPVFTPALFRNDGAFRMTAVPDAAMATDTTPGLGGAWGDYDGDGDLDLAVSTRSGRSNRLYRNDGGGRFTRMLDGPHVLDASDASGIAWVDYDNDGDLDLFSHNWGAPSVLYTNQGEGRFERLEHGDLGRVFTHASSATWGDYDGDGDLDLYAGNWPNWPGEDEPNHLYRNDAPARSWLQLDLAGTASNRSAIGARVTVRARIGGRDVSQVRELFPTAGFRGHNAMRLHFGLGDARAVEEVVVRWPSGRVQRLGGIEPGRVLRVTEPGAAGGDPS